MEPHHGSDLRWLRELLEDLEQLGLSRLALGHREILSVRHSRGDNYRPANRFGIESRHAWLLTYAAVLRVAVGRFFFWMACIEKV